ncbi:hypothetical protein OGZ51_07170 [Lactococcus lactis]|uniref:Uncharacterized protein n=1 Tax=Lactococcus lactis TaxID=1358 RepID=A0A9X4NH20_9LACT|nr:hypothetical protein [Lactococcus lactis]MDG4983921.1 hypothetical protein [Lactococcus lactis]
MLNHLITATPYLTELRKDIKNKKFWFVQSLTLIRATTKMINLLVMLYSIMIIMSWFLHSSMLNFSHVQQNNIVNSLQVFIYFGLYFELALWMIKTFVGVSPLNFVRFFSRELFYSLFIITINLALSQAFIQSVTTDDFLSFIISGFLIFNFMKFILFKLLFRKVTKEKSLKTWKEWLVLDKVEKRYDYLPSDSSSNHAIEEAEYCSCLTHIVTVRLKYSKIRVCREFRTLYSKTENEVTDLWLGEETKVYSLLEKLKQKLTNHSKL